MSIKEEQLWVNDYLDLYIYAGSMGDISWQQEIIEKLHNFHNEIRKQTPSFVFNNLLKEYKHINEEILTISHQLRDQPSNSYLHEKILELQQQRISLDIEIRLVKNQL